MVRSRFGAVPRHRPHALREEPHHRRGVARAVEVAKTRVEADSTFRIPGVGIAGWENEGRESRRQEDALHRQQTGALVGVEEELRARREEKGRDGALAGGRRRGETGSRQMSPTCLWGHRHMDLDADELETTTILR